MHITGKALLFLQNTHRFTLFFYKKKVSVVVIMFELTGQITYILPTMVS